MSMFALARAGPRLLFTLPLSRHVHASQALAKQQRRQEPFDFNLPPDPLAIKERGVKKARLAELEFLQKLEAGHASAAEKYSKGFGLRKGARSSAETEDVDADAAASATEPRALNTNWRAAQRRFQKGQESLPGLTAKKVGQMGAGRKRRAYMPDIVEPETWEERRMREQKKAKEIGVAETEEEALRRAEIMAKRGIKTKWNPKRKLTYAAMAGLKELHLQDPETWTVEKLGSTYGISYEAVKRVLRSNYQDRNAPPSGVPVSLSVIEQQKLLATSAPPSGATTLAPGKWAAAPALGTTTATATDREAQEAVMTKWDKAKAHGRQASSVARIQRAYDIKRRVEGSTPASNEPAVPRKTGFGLKKSDE